MCFLPFAVGQILAAPNSARVVNRIGYRARDGRRACSWCTLSLAALAAMLHLDTPLWLILTPSSSSASAWAT